MRDIYLIDFENVASDGLSGIASLSPEDQVIIFYSNNSNRLTMKMHILIGKSVCQLRYFEAAVGGKNALDHQIATWLGYLVGTQAAERNYYIVSKDAGYKYVAGFWSDTDPRPSIRCISSIRAELEQSQKREAQAVSAPAEPPVPQPEPAAPQPSETAEQPKAQKKPDAVRQDAHRTDRRNEVKKTTARRSQRSGSRQKQNPGQALMVVPSTPQAAEPRQAGKPQESRPEPMPQETKPMAQEPKAQEPKPRTQEPQEAKQDARQAPKSRSSQRSRQKTEEPRKVELGPMLAPYPNLQEQYLQQLIAENKRQALCNTLRKHLGQEKGLALYNEIKKRAWH